MEVPPELRQPVRAERIDPFEGELMYQPDYHEAYDSGPVLRYEPISDTTMPWWMWPVVGL